MSDVFAQIAAAMGEGDTQALGALAMKLASEVEKLHALAEADAARKAGQRERTRRHRNAVQRDVTLQSVTERDSAEQGSPSPQVSLSSPTPLINPSFPPPSPTPPPARREKAPRTIRVVPARPDVAAVLTHYTGLHPRRRPDAKSEKAICRALETYSVLELCEAISGNATDRWARETGNQGLPYVLRDNAQIDKYRALCTAEPEMLIVDGWYVDRVPA